MKTINTTCVDQWGWVRTTSVGVGPLKTKTILEVSMADSCRDEARQLMYRTAAEESLAIPLATAKRRGPSTVVVKAPLQKVVYELCHWVHVD